MNKLFANKKILLALRLLMGSVFILASIDKIFNPAVFSSVLREYKLLPEILIPLVSVTLPWMEFFAGLLIILNIFSQSVALIMILFNTGYILGITINLAWGLAHECGCFTLFGWNEPISGSTIARDLFFVLLCVPILFYASNEFKYKSK